MIKSTSNMGDLDVGMEEALDTELNQELNDLALKDQTLNVGLGLTDEALNEAIEYMAGATSAPRYMEGFSNEKLKNFTTVATVAQVARVPGLIKLLNETNALLFASNELQTMDMNDLTKLSKSLSEEVRLILDSARKTLDTLDKLDAPVSPNQQLLDKLLQMPDDEIRAMQEYLAGKKNQG